VGIWESSNPIISTFVRRPTRSTIVEIAGHMETKNSRDDRTAIELFLLGLGDGKSSARQLLLIAPAIS
jgi:hypothetical protein